MSAGRNEPLKKDKLKWKSDYPMTEGQLRSKRDEFWDTAPAFEGRKEIWDALKAAAVALECNDHELAQAIVDGANITLPHGESRLAVMKPADVFRTEIGEIWKNVHAALFHSTFKNYKINSIKAVYVTNMIHSMSILCNSKNSLGNAPKYKLFKF